MTTHHAWLQNEASDWANEGLISDEVRDTLRERYPVNAQSPAAPDTQPSRRRLSWLSVVIPAIGAVIAGLGVILFFAYNWSDMPKWLKLLVVFGALLGAHAAGLWSGRHQRTASSETFHLLGSMLFGAGIWLIAQIYHIDEHYPNAFLVWGAGALLMGWALRSTLQAQLASVLFAIWVGAELGDFNRAPWWAPVPFLLGLLPLGWLKRSPAVVFSAVLGTLFTINASLTAHWTRFDDLLPFLMGSGLVAVSTLLPAARFPGGPAAVRVAALVPYAATLFALVFIRYVPKTLVEQQPYLWGAAVVAALWLASIVSGRFRSAGAGQAWQNALNLLAVLCITATVLHLVPMIALKIVLTLLVAGHAILLIRQGVSSGSRLRTVIGFLIIGALIALRFTDLFHSLLARSAAFLVFGMALMAAGLWYSRRHDLSRPGATPGGDQP